MIDVLDRRRDTPATSGRQTEDRKPRVHRCPPELKVGVMTCWATRMPHESNRVGHPRRWQAGAAVERLEPGNRPDLAPAQRAARPSHLASAVGESQGRSTARDPDVPDRHRAVGGSPSRSWWRPDHPVRMIPESAASAIVTPFPDESVDDAAKAPAGPNRIDQRPFIAPASLDARGRARPASHAPNGRAAS